MTVTSADASLRIPRRTCARATRYRRASADSAAASAAAAGLSTTEPFRRFQGSGLDRPLPEVIERRSALRSISAAPSSTIGRVSSGTPSVAVAVVVAGGAAASSSLL